MTLVLACLLLAALGGSQASHRHNEKEWRMEMPNDTTINIIAREITEVLDEYPEGYTRDEIVGKMTIAFVEANVSKYFGCCDDKDYCNKKAGGYCVQTNWWHLVPLVTPYGYHCDIQLHKYCSPKWVGWPWWKGCHCCIVCRENRRSDCWYDPNTDCKKQCSNSEFKVAKSCHSPYCSCCQECQQERECTEVGGYCVNDPIHCITPLNSTTPYYASLCGCKGTGCHCCRPSGPCEWLPTCRSRFGFGYCTMGDSCHNKYYTLSPTGCAGPNCKCCIPNYPYVPPISKIESQTEKASDPESP